MDISYDVCKAAGMPSPRYIQVDNFLEYSNLVLDVVADWDSQTIEKNEGWATEWLRGFMTLRDDFEFEAERDPMILYKPKHSVSRAFHESLARVRYYRAGNRTSKTQSGYAEHYFIATKQPLYRNYGDISGPQMTFILAGLPFTIYEGDVFEKKFITGEPGNPLSPMFPEGGKWLNRYDKKAHSVTIACPDCAEKGKAGSCRHRNRSKITLLSTELGVGVVEAFKAKLAHIDEHVPEKFYTAIKMRLQDTRDSSIIVTSTPSQGIHGWEQKRLAAVAEGPREKNLSDPENPNSVPYVELFEIDQYSAGIAPHENIRASEQDMTEFEKAARIYGKPVAISDTPVFDQLVLDEMLKKCKEAQFFDMVLENEGEQDEDLFTLSDVASHDGNYKNCDIKLHESNVTGKTTDWSGLRVYELPQMGANYIAGIDTAQGMTDNDASCCSILRLIKDPKTMQLKIRLVAQWWGWKTTIKYAREVFKLCTLYNDALAVIETTGGYGDSVLQVLRDELYYPALFRDRSDKKQTQFNLGGRFGVDTNETTKPYFVGCLQDFIEDNALECWDRPTIEELIAYEQQNEGVSGQKLQKVRYGGAHGHKDDRVMSLAIAAGVAMSHIEMFDFEEEWRAMKDNQLGVTHV